MQNLIKICLSKNSALTNTKCRVWVQLFFDKSPLDALSLAIYFLMWRHFRRSVNASASASAMEVGEEPHGGIYMGPNAKEEEEDGQKKSDPTTANSAEDAGDDHRSGAAMRALAVHLRLSLADVAFILLSLFSCDARVVPLFYAYQVVCFFWMPFLVVRTSFKQFGRLSFGRFCC